MSDHPQGEGWWLASDGKWYPPESVPEPPASEASLIFLSESLSRTVVGFLWVLAALNGLAVILDLGDVGADENAQITLGGLYTLGFLATVVLFIVWFFKAYKAAQSRGGTGRRWSAGWAVGAWFIPFANLVIPKLVMNEIDRMSNPDAGPPPIDNRWEGLPRLQTSEWWWAVWIASIALTYIAAFTLRSDLELSAVASVLTGVAAGLGAVTVQSIGDRLKDPDRTMRHGP